MVKSRYIGDGHPTFNRNPYNRYINPYYWVDDHPLLYGNNGSLDPGTDDCCMSRTIRTESVKHKATKVGFQSILEKPIKHIEKGVPHGLQSKFVYIYIYFLFCFFNLDFFLESIS